MDAAFGGGNEDAPHVLDLKKKIGHNRFGHRGPANVAVADEKDAHGFSSLRTPQIGEYLDSLGTVLGFPSMRMVLSSFMVVFLVNICIRRFSFR